MHLKTIKMLIFLTIGCLVMAATAFASDVTINGFAHQSYIKTDTNTYVVDNAHDGSYKDYMVGLTFTAKPSDKVYLRAQVISTDDGIGLDWGFGEYHLNENIGIKAGKMKLPYGFYTELLSVKALQPFVFLPGIYSYGINSVNGLGVFGNYELDNGWGGSLDLYTGYFPAGSGGSLDDILGFQAWITPPVDGLRVGFGNFKTTLNVPLYGTEMDMSLMMISGEYVGDKFFIRTEYSTVGVDETDVQTNIYAEAGYLVHEMIQPVVRWTSWTNDQWVDNGGLPDMFGRPELTETETGIAIGVNIFPATGFIVKAEYHMIDGTSSFGPGNQDPTAMMNPAPDEKWNMFALSTTFMF